MDAFADYLRIPDGYDLFVQRLRWSPSGEAIEYDDGGTFVLAPQLALFLEGLAAGGPVPHFALVLHLLYLFGLGRDTPAPRPLELVQAFQESGRPLRNAGVLAALLCRRVPPPATPLDTAHLCQWLASSSLMANLARRWWVRLLSPPVEKPPLRPEEFGALVRQALTVFSSADLLHWLRHGRGPLPPTAQQLAQALPIGQPRTLGHVLAELTQRPRLAGALPFVAQLVSALSLPPRRLAHQELPIGGYADVTTRGHPEQLLPSQFVIEDAGEEGGTGALSLEFVRRYAENELLYFRREEPHARLQEELVLLLDQGVRTWGEVRLVLSAAVLAFGKLAERRHLPFLLAATSTEGRRLDALAADPAALAQLVEASDLSANPGLALERLLEERTQTFQDNHCPTDVVLLTHPRNLAEPDVLAAARRAGGGVRLFAVTVDGHGNVQLCALKHGTPVKLGQFRLDLGGSPGGTTAAAVANDPLAAWRGDVEPVPFPFLGIIGVAPPHRFAFDQAGEWFLQAGPRGMLHAWRTHTPHLEVLPRALVNGLLLNTVDEVLGVCQGFVVAGRLQGDLAAVHYDFARRSCTAHILGAAGGSTWMWSYFPDLHTVVVCLRRHAEGLGSGPVYAVDLASGAREVHGPRTTGAAVRVAEACARAEKQAFPPPSLSLGYEPLSQPCKHPCLILDEKTGRLTPAGLCPAWTPFVPQSEGRPLLQHAEILAAQCRGWVMAVLCRHPGEGQHVLRLFRGPEGIPLGEVVQPPHLPHFLLSATGHLLARSIGGAQFEVRDISAGLSVLGKTPVSRGQRPPQLRLGEMWLTLRDGKGMHLVRWDRGVLELGFSVGDHKEFLESQLAGTLLLRQGITASSAGVPRFLLYDRHRFVGAALAALVAVIDTWGNVALLERTGKLVCMFCNHRHQLAAWMPDGTRYGPSALLGGPSTPNALARIGAALRQAWERGEETVVV